MRNDDEAPTRDKVAFVPVNSDTVQLSSIPNDSKTPTPFSATAMVAMDLSEAEESFEPYLKVAPLFNVTVPRMSPHPGGAAHPPTKRHCST